MKNCVATSGNGNRFLECNKIFQVKELYIYFGFDDRLTLTEIEMSHTMEVIKNFYVIIRFRM